jgi:hypothetical protein
MGIRASICNWHIGDGKRVDQKRFFNNYPCKLGILKNNNNNNKFWLLRLMGGSKND